MNEGIIQIIIGLGGGAGVTALIAGLFNRNKTKAEKEQIGAEAAQIITNAAKGLVDDYRNDNIKLREKLAQTEARLEEVTDRLDDAVAALREAIPLLRAGGADLSRVVRRLDDHTMAEIDGL